MNKDFEDNINDMILNIKDLARGLYTLINKFIKK